MSEAAERLRRVHEVGESCRAVYGSDMTGYTADLEWVVDQYLAEHRPDDGEPLVCWVRDDAERGWKLTVKGREFAVAWAWDNGTWHTFDCDGVGGENDVETTVGRAKVEAAASAIAQGFI